MASVGSQLGAPGANDKVLGRFSNVRFIRCEAATSPQAAAVTSINGLQGYSIGDPDIKFSAEVFQAGGGNDSYKQEIGREWPVQLDFLQGVAWDEMAALLGITLHISTGDSMIPMVRQNDYPDVIIEACIREADNDTHIGSIVIPDVRIGNVVWGQGLEDDTFTVPGMTKLPSGMLMPGAELVYEQFTGDGSTVDFVLGNTPLNLTTSANWDHLYFDDFFYIKTKASTASTGTVQTSGFSLTTATITATTAPASGTILQVLYAKAIS